MAERMPSYGGQALIEGVLMRGAHGLAAAMRKPDGTIVVETEPLKGIYLSKIKNIPFLRGLIMLWDALVLGTRYLTKSANMQSGEDDKIEGPALYLTLGLSLVIGVGLFVILPSLVGQGLERLLGFNWLALNVGEGIFRALLAIGYIWGIGRMKEIRRVFQYHGAEHKTINAFEAGAEMKPEIVTRYSLEHPRCGTGFILTVVIFSIILFSPLRSLTFGIRVLTQLALVPVIACLAYEYIRWTARNLNSRFVRWLIKPNLALQALTTREPDLGMIEVSICAFNAMLAHEKQVEKIDVAVMEKLPMESNA